MYLGILGAILFSPNQGDFSLQTGPWRGVASHLLASEMPKGGAKLTLSEAREQQLDRFSSSCEATLL